MADEHFRGHKTCDMLDNSFYFMSQMTLLKWFWNPIWQASGFLNPSVTSMHFMSQPKIHRSLVIYIPYQAIAHEASVSSSVQQENICLENTVC